MGDILKVGARAPEFTVKADDGKEVALKDFRGKNVVLYFFPKAMTPGWTNEASEFRDAKKKFDKLNTVILGCSADSVDRQAKFKEKYNLNFALLSDLKFEVIEAYGARRMKSFLGKSFLGIVRMSYWINPEGKVQHVWEKAPSKGHAAEVLEVIEGK